MYIEIVNQFVPIVHIQILSQQTPVTYLLWANQVLCAVRKMKNEKRLSLVEAGITETQNQFCNRGAVMRPVETQMWKTKARGMGL